MDQSNITMVLHIESDVLVIGAGGAGLRAAIEAEAHGASVCVASKAPAGMNNATVVSGGGFRAAMGGLDPDEYLRDTMEVGKGLNDHRLVEVLAREGGGRLLELRRFGVDVHEHPGGCSVDAVQGLGGLGITKPLVEYTRARGVQFVENVVVTRLLSDGVAVIGAVGYDAHADRPVIFSSKAVVLASGGAGALYKRTDCPLRTTGDGYSLAYEAGMRLRDMEFVQFFPLALAEPGAPPYLIGQPVSEEGRIVNRLGEDIPRKYGLTARPLVLKSRDLLSRAVMREILGGRGIDSAVLVDARQVFRSRDDLEEFSTGPTAFFRDRLKADERPFRVAPICHFCMGGVVADERGDTGVPGLYAAGEVVGGVHGANRHGGNALTETIVFGARAGASAAEFAGASPRVSVEPLARAELERYDFIRGGGIEEGGNSASLMSRLRESMWTKAGIVREGAGLESMLSEIEVMREALPRLRATSSRTLLEALEVPMALTVAEMIVRSALERTESRGAHYRTDYPEEDERWLRPVVLRRDTDGRMSLSHG
jgi:succinate dehydrogenase/fumarate reductase flavoprotein subunit